MVFLLIKNKIYNAYGYLLIGNIRIIRRIILVVGFPFFNL